MSHNGRVCIDMSALTLNISRPPTTRAKELLTWLIDREEDVFVLTEAGSGEGSGSAWLRKVFEAAGCSVLDGVRGTGGLGVLLIGRTVELVPDDRAPKSPVPGRILAATIRSGDGAVLRIAGVYGAASDPIRYASSAQRQRKREWLTAYHAWLGEWLTHEVPALVLGDLNIIDPVHDGDLPYVLKEEPQAYADHLGTHGLVDLWRANNPDSIEASWVDHSGVGCRYDHAFATTDAARHVTGCSLDHAPRDLELTDHSALTVRLSPRPA